MSSMNDYEHGNAFEWHVRQQSYTREWEWWKCWLHWSENNRAMQWELKQRSNLVIVATGCDDRKARTQRPSPVPDVCAIPPRGLQTHGDLCNLVLQWFWKRSLPVRWIPSRGADCFRSCLKDHGGYYVDTGLTQVSAKLRAVSQVQLMDLVSER